MTRYTANCGECDARVTKQRPNVQCAECSRWYHSRQCTNLSEIEERLMIDQGKSWSCGKCRRLTMHELSITQCSNKGPSGTQNWRKSISPGPRDIESIYSLLIELKGEVGQLSNNVTEVKKSLEFLNGMYEEQRQWNKVMGEMIEENKKENKKLREELSLVQTKLAEMEAEKVSNRLIINGAFENGDTEEVLMERSLRVLKHIDNSIEKQNIVHVKSIHVKQKPPMASVTFDNSGYVKKIMQKRREFRNLDTRACGILETSKPIYINEYLPELTYKLLKDAKKCKEKGFKYVWCQNGSVLLRKKDGDRIVKIRNSVHLQNILKAPGEN